MTNQLEKELENILFQISKKEVSLEKTSELYFEALKKPNDYERKEITNKVGEVMANIFVMFIGKNRDYCEKLQKGKSFPTNKRLDELEANFKEILKVIDKANQEIPQVVDDDYCLKTKKGIEKAKELIQEARKIANIVDQLNDAKSDEKEFSWQKVKELYNQLKNLPAEQPWIEMYDMAKKGVLLELAEGAFHVAAAANEGKEIPPNAYPSTDEELNFLQEIADEVPKMLDWLERERASEIKDSTLFPKMRQGCEQLKSFIQQERKKHGYSSRPNQPKSPQNTQQIQSLQKEINSLNQKITELQNEITELKKQNPNPDQNTNPEIQQKIATLESQKNQIKETLKQKQSQQEKIKQQANPQQPNNGFNWLYVVIPGAVLLVVMGIIIAYLIGKKNKKE